MKKINLELKLDKDELKKKLDIKDGENGIDGSPDTGHEIVKKINDLPLHVESQIDASHIKNLSTILIGGGGGSNSSSGSSGSGDVTKVGTPANNQVGVWTGDGTLEGATDLVFDGTNFGIGTTAPDKKLEVNLGTSNAFRLTYNDADGGATTYMDTTMSSAGSVSLTNVGTTPQFNFIGDKAGTISFSVNNTNASGSATFLASTDGTGDAYARFTIPATSWSAGIDNSTSDSFKISNNTAPGTNDYLTITTGGVVTVSTVGTGAGSVVSVDGTQTLTNKAITKRVVTTTDDATAVIDVAVTDTYELSAIANNTTFSFTGTPTDGQQFIVRYKDAGVSKTLTWTAITAIGVTLPTATTTNKWGYVGIIYNAAATAYHATAVATEA